MDMGSDKPVEKIAMSDEVYTCPACQYTDGFHVGFKKIEREIFRVVLICPRCHSRFETGWRAMQDPASC